MAEDSHENFAGKHLVIFGCGYVGAEFGRQGLARGMRVTALTRNPEKAAILRAAGIETVVADLASDAWHEWIGGDADFILNAVSSGGGGLGGYRRSYLEGMQSVLAWMRAQASGATLAYTSSTSVYPQDGGVAVDETSPVSPRDERSEVLIETEDLLLQSPVGALRWFVLRLAGIYGPGRHHLVEQVRGGEVSGVAGNHLNLIHQHDVCSAAWSVFEAEPAMLERVFNVVDDAPATKGEVAGWLARELGVPEPTFTGAPMIGRRAVTPNRVIVNARLKSALGWVPRYPTFREGYRNFLSR
ncbi:MAG: Epimerase [Verrucomicrobia bacterium]|nr:Epimerase [Verrucomicrobiota bacterium]